MAWLHAAIEPAVAGHVRAAGEASRQERQVRRDRRAGESAGEGVASSAASPFAEVGAAGEVAAVFANKSE